MIKSDEVENVVVETATEIENSTKKVVVEETETVVEETENDSADVEEDVYVALYTSIEDDKESLIELVKNTIISAQSQMNFNLSETSDDALQFNQAILSPALAAFADSSLDKTQKFPYGNDFNPFVEVNSDSENWTYEDIAGCLGYFILVFDEEHKTTDYYQPETDEYLKHFFLYNFYNCDVNKIEENSWELSGCTDTYYGAKENPYGTSEVNYTLSFKYNGTSYTAVIGNINGAYRVFDIVKTNIDKAGYVDTNGKNSKTSSNQNTNNPNNGNVAHQQEETNPDEIPNNIAPDESTGNNDTSIPNESDIPEGYGYNPITGQIELAVDDLPSDGSPVIESGIQNPNCY